MEYKYKQIVVAGVGGVGWPLVVSLCQVLDRAVPVLIYDPDTFEGGRGYTRFPHVFKPETFKVDWLRAHIETIWRKSPPYPFAKKLTVRDFKNKDWTGILVVDCTDMDPKPRRQLWAAAVKAGATMMRVSYDGKVANVARGLPLLSTEAQEGPGGYQEPPDLPMSFAAGGWGAKYVLHALETGEVEEGVLRVPLVNNQGAGAPKEEVDVMAQAASGELPNSPKDKRRRVHGRVGDSGTGGGRKRRT